MCGRCKGPSTEMQLPTHASLLCTSLDMQPEDLMLVPGNSNVNSTMFRIQAYTDYQAAVKPMTSIPEAADINSVTEATACHCQQQRASSSELTAGRLLV